MKGRLTSSPEMDSSSKIDSGRRLISKLCFRLSLDTPALCRHSGHPHIRSGRLAKITAVGDGGATVF